MHLETEREDRGTACRYRSGPYEDVHGKSELGPDMIAKIKNAFSNPAPIEVKENGEPFMKEYTCDLGAKCGWHSVARPKN